MSGRRSASREQFWREAVAGQASSGLSVRGYCRRHRLGEAAFYFWRRNLAERQAKPGTGFVPVRIADDPAAVGSPGPARAGGRIEIVLGNGCRVRLAGPVDGPALAEVLTVLDAAAGAAEGRPC